MRRIGAVRLSRHLQPRAGSQRLQSCQHRRLHDVPSGCCHSRQWRKETRPCARCPPASCAHGPPHAHSTRPARQTPCPQLTRALRRPPQAPAPPHNAARTWMCTAIPCTTTPTSPRLRGSFPAQLPRGSSACSSHRLAPSTSTAPAASATPLQPGPAGDAMLHNWTVIRPARLSHQRAAASRGGSGMRPLAWACPTCHEPAWQGVRTGRGQHCRHKQHLRAPTGHWAGLRRLEACPLRAHKVRWSLPGLDR